MAFPTVVATQASQNGTTNTTTFNATLGTLQASALAGDMVFVFISADGNPTLTLSTPTGDTVWDRTGVFVGPISSTTICSGYVAYCTIESDGVLENLRMASSVSEQYSYIAYLVRPPAGSTIGTNSANWGSSVGSSTNSNPGILGPVGTAGDYLVIASRHGDSTVVATAAPSGYTNLLTQAAGGTAGASTNTAIKTRTMAAGDSEDPAVFTSASEQWACWTVGIFEIPGSGGGPTRRAARSSYWL